MNIDRSEIIPAGQLMLNLVKQNTAWLILNMNCNKATATKVFSFSRSRMHRTPHERHKLQANKSLAADFVPFSSEATGTLDEFPLIFKLLHFLWHWSS